MSRRLPQSLGWLLAIPLLLLGTQGAHAASVVKQDLVDLISLSDQIIVGQVLSVTDGLDNGVPYTEVSVLVEEAVRGNANTIYTYRQFGLLAPRDMGDGTVNLNVSPDGWPRYAAGERVVLFLYQAASLTGLRTTVGLFQGKFNVRDGMVSNAIENIGLFEGVSVESGLLSDSEAKCMGSSGGAVPLADLVSIVRKAVDQRWIEEGRMSND